MGTRLGRLYRFMTVSLAKTLAAKLGISKREVFDTLGCEVPTPLGPRKVILVREPCEGKPDRVAYFGGINLVRMKVIENYDPPLFTPFNPRVELIERAQAAQCELCGAIGPCQVRVGAP